MAVILLVFVLPIAARAAMFAMSDLPTNYRNADWSSIGRLASAASDPDARVLILSGRTGGWKGIFSVHSWIVLKDTNARTWTRYDVVGWGSPVRINGWAPDGRWFGNRPIVVADIRGAVAEGMIPRIESAVKHYRYRNAGDYRLWPGPNSNSFVAAIIRDVPALGTTLPCNAMGRDFRPMPYIGWTDSGTGFEANLWGIFGIKIGWVEGIEVNFLGLVAGVDLRHPALKIPGFGRLTLGSGPPPISA